MGRIIREECQRPPLSRLDGKDCDCGIDWTCLANLVRVSNPRVHHGNVRALTGKDRRRILGSAWSHDPAPAMNKLRAFAFSPADPGGHTILPCPDDGFSDPRNEKTYVLWLDIVTMTAIGRRCGVRMS